MRRVLAAFAGFLAAPLALEWAAWLPPFFLLGPGALSQLIGPGAVPTPIASPVLTATGLLLSWAFRRGAFERLSAALGVGLTAGLAAAAASVLHHDAATARFAFLVSLGWWGMVCGFVMHAVAAGLRAGLHPGPDAGRRAGLQQADADRFADPLLATSAVLPWYRPIARVAVVLDRRHPARLKQVYRPFHVAVSWTFAVAWLAALCGLWFGIQHVAGGGLDAALRSLAGPMSALLAAVLACAALVLTASIAWWVTAAVCVSAAVRTGALPPFDTALYVRDGTFPSHWIAHEHAGRG